MVRALCAPVRPFLPLTQRRNTPRNFEIKRLFRNAFSERSKRSEKERDERSLHGVPGPCSQVRPCLLAELKRDTPRNFDMKRLIRNAFSERPKFRPDWSLFLCRFFFFFYAQNPGNVHNALGSQRPSPNVKSPPRIRAANWLEIVTSRDAKSACFQGSQTSCTEIISVIFCQNLAEKDHIT